MENNRCILLVDDEPNITNALKRELHEWTLERSLDIVTAQSAMQGLAILEQKGAGTVLVVSDLKMPEMLGSDFLLVVKRLYPDIVSMLLTGHSEASEIIKIVQANIFSFILKPWDSSYLLAELTKAYDYHELRLQNNTYMKTMEDELRWAGEMQKTILRPNLPSSEGLEFRVSYRPVPGLYCGGDYYDVIAIGVDRYLLLIGEVEGHGVKAAIVTGILKSTIYSEYIRASLGRDFSPGIFLSWLNDRMNFEFRAGSSMMITFFAGVLDLKTGRFRYANAGHNHPFVLRGGKAVELPVSGSAIGFAAKVSYAENVVNIIPGDVLILHTDGLAHAGLASEFAPLRLGPLLNTLPYGADYHRRLLEAALAATKARDFTDDVTILTAKVL